jgi:diguanylate cyclase (GGDEF)-like protein/PAS domain S-box-containing protein
MEANLKAKLFESIIEFSDDAIISKTLDGIIVSWNAAAVAIFGYTAEEIIGRSITTLFPPGRETEEADILARIKQGVKVAHFETVRQRKDGILIDVSVTISPIRDGDGNIAGASKIVRDITQQKFLERQLATSRELFEDIVESSDDAIISKTLDGTIITWNPAAEAIFGYAPDEIVGKNIAVLSPPERQTETADFLARLKRDEKIDHFETVGLCKNGVPVDVSVSISTIHDNDGNIVGASIIARDITRRKYLERKLADSKALIEDLYNHAPCGYHSLDANGIIVHINDTELEWLGCTRHEVVGKKKFSDFITPESKQRFEANFPKFKVTGLAQNLEYEIVGKDGRLRHISLSATALKDDQDNFLRSRSVLYDMTELKKSQDTLRQLVAEQQVMLNNDLVGFLKIHNRRIVWANREMERISGYTAEELQGQSSRIFYADALSYQALSLEVHNILDDDGIFRKQAEFLRKDGEKIWIDLNGMKLPANEAGESILYVLKDITEQIKYQQQVEHIAYHDNLTGLPNRLLVDDRLQQALAHAKRANQALAICYLDLDGFKPVNDSYGHAAGDKLLLEVTKRMQAAVRANDTVGRLGGDEFVLLLTGLDNADDYLLVLQRVLAAINSPILLENMAEVTVGASIGVALYPADSSEADTLLRHADQAMYHAKKSGRNRICLYSKTGYK